MRLVCTSIYSAIVAYPFPVLRAICRNPEGLFWAGDTAQTISTGSAFRFNDLKALMYRIEVSHALMVHTIVILTMIVLRRRQPRRGD